MDSAMPNAIAEAMAYFSVYGQYDITNMNAVAWYFFQHRTDKKELEAALQWAQTVIAHEPTTNHYDTYANLLYKLGRRGEAVKAMEKGFTLREGNGNMEEIKNNYEKMKRGEPTWPSR
jgi:tetratricopeptide (TPR) repeat protein